LDLKFETSCNLIQQIRTGHSFLTGNFRENWTILPKQTGQQAPGGVTMTPHCPMTLQVAVRTQNVSPEEQWHCWQPSADGHEAPSSYVTPSTVHEPLVERDADVGHDSDPCT
jgi:hypothetical protein